MTKKTFLAANDVHKIYRSGRKEVKAVNGININITQGSSLAIVGPSGAGKSTILHLLGGLDRPTSGKVEIDGVDIYRISDRERAKIRNRRIGFVFQFYHLLPEFTALENVLMPGLIKGQGARGKGQGKDGRRLRDRAQELLETVGLKDRASHRPGELSGGESQRVAIARALINEPEVLLCDEPTGNLDSKNSQAIYDLLFYLKAKSNMALVIVTHDEKISVMTDDILRIKDGKAS